MSITGPGGNRRFWESVANSAERSLRERAVLLLHMKTSPYAEVLGYPAWQFAFRPRKED